MMAKLQYADLLGADIAFLAVDNYRFLRRRSITARSLVDVIIASFCILHGYYLLHGDRDFDAMASHIGLRTPRDLSRATKRPPPSTTWCRSTASGRPCTPGAACGRWIRSSSRPPCGPALRW
jgi:hypothetical protein